MPLFEPGFYRAQARGRGIRVNSLLHYAWVGRYLQNAPSPWFDLHYYLSNNHDVARAGVEPLHHYLLYGGQERRSPSPMFDANWYLQQHPELVESRENPLVHYLRFGHAAGLPTCPSQALESEEPPPSVAPNTDWNAMLGRMLPIQGHGKPGVDVIVPVYKGRDLTLRCLFSVLNARYETPMELIVINDASPDAELVAELEQLAARSLFTLLHNEHNLGFVQTVNRGMALHPERDVVLLNADTEVYSDWLDRLRMVAERNPRTATVTPLSNNATICSYPRFLHDNPYPLEMPGDAIDHCTAKVNRGIEVEAPTGVGFCMYLRRDALDELGLFDAEAYGKGYGEENDFCQRAIQQGWRNVITADTFVRHLGGASFQGEKGKRVAHALRTLAQRYPNYKQQVSAFIRQDPLQEARRRLDMARLGQHVREENVLIVCHNRGGGTERHVQEDTSYLMKEGKGVFYLRPVRGKPSHVHLAHPVCRQLLNLPSVALSDTRQLTNLLTELKITRIHSHGMVDFTARAPDHLSDLVMALQIPLHVDIHDYKVICPRINLADENGLYCREPDEASCNACLKTRGNSFGETSIQTWRQSHHQVLRQAARIWVPHQDVGTRLLRYYPDLEISVSPHDNIAGPINTSPPPRLPGEPLHIVVIGAISQLKGFDVLLGCARDARKRNLPLRFTVMGYTKNDIPLRQQGVTITGKYHENEALEKLAGLKPHLVWLPSIWPETYSYTLSLALQHGSPIAAFDLGAIAARLRESEHPHLLTPLERARDVSWINARFIEKVSVYSPPPESSPIAPSP